MCDQHARMDRKNLYKVVTKSEESEKTLAKNMNKT